MVSAGDYFPADFIYLFPQISRISQIFFLKFFCVNQRYQREIIFLQISFIFPSDLANLAGFFLLKVFCVNQCYPREIIFPADFIYLFPQISRISQIFSLKSLLRKSALSAGDYFSCRFHLFFPADLANLADFFS